MSKALDATWSRIQDELRRAVTETAYESWLAGLRPVELTERALVVVAPDKTRGWVADRFGRIIQICAAAVIGPEVEVDIIAASPRGAGRRRTTGRHHGTLAAQREQPTSAEQHGVFNPKYTFDQFVIGDANRLAHAAALAVAELPGQAYNPLFIYGAPGLGKTHLLHAIANYVTAYDTALSAHYTTAEAFTNHFLTALQSGAVESFKQQYRRSDVLLIDDVQFLERKARTEEEFFHTFNALYEAGAQLVITSDRPPRDLAGLEDRLRERFEAGLMTDVKPPDFTTRLAILRKRVSHDGIALAEPEALEVVADRISLNIRVLEGALIRVVAFHSLTRRPITAALATEVLEGLYPESRPTRRTIRDIQLATAEAFAISLDDLVSQSRSARLAWPRQVAMYLARELTDQTLPAIGRAFGGRNHATVIHACRRISERIAQDPDAFAAVQALTTRLQSAAAAQPPDPDRMT